MASESDVAAPEYGKSSKRKDVLLCGEVANCRQLEANIANNAPRFDNSAVEDMLADLCSYPANEND